MDQKLGADTRYFRRKNNMKKVLLIGNSGDGKDVRDGGSIKVVLYKKCLEKSGNTVELVNLLNWKKHPFSLIGQIKQGIKNNDVILIMGGPNGSRVLIPLINRLNKKCNKRTVYCPLGIGVVEKTIKKLKSNEANDFIKCHNFFNINDSKMGNALKKMSLIIPQNNTLANLYKNFYKIDNVETLSNFRDIDVVPRNYMKHNPFKIIYLSRIKENKGIFLLIDAVNKIDNVSLDIYGDLQLTHEEESKFNCSLNEKIKYCGTCDSETSIEVISQYDLFCLPTKYKGEGTSGAYIESLIAGTPVLLSSYSQAMELVKDGVNGFIFELNNLDNLINKIKQISKEDIANVSKNEQILAQKYTFEHNKSQFLNLILGDC